jgi:hypothetical protein
VTANELANLLREFYRDKRDMRQRHADSARLVSHYDFNNTYQYIIAREDVHLNWLRDTLADAGASVEDIPSGAAREAGAAAHDSGKPARRDADAEHSAIAADRDAAQAFVEKWRPRLDAVSNARHRTMLRVIIGETLEHQRFFEQAVAGRSDLLGRRADGAGTGGGVLATRWVE